MKPGPKPGPRAINFINVNPGNRSLNENELNPEQITLKCPDWLDKEAKEKWEELASELEKLGLFTLIDGQAFALMCTHWGLAVEAIKPLQRDGSTVLDERGLFRKHPACQVLRDNSASFTRYMAEFGLTPSSRSRLNITPPLDNEDDLYDTSAFRA